MKREREAPGPRAEPGAGRWATIALLAALAVGTGLRFYWQKPETLWLDESNSVLIASRGPAAIVEALREDSNPPFFYLLLHAWIRAFGDGETGLRVLSGILGSLLPPLLWLAGRFLLGRAAGCAAAILAALAPIHVFYSHEIRMYSLVPVLSLAFIAAVLAALARSGGTSWRRWALIAAAAIPLLYTHTFGLFVVAAAPVAWLVRGPRTRAVALRLGVTMFVVLLADLWWLPVIRYQAGRGSAEWIAALYHGARAPIESLVLFGAGGRYPDYLRILGGPSPLAWLAWIWMPVTVLASLWLGLRDARLGGHVRALAAFLVVGLGLPYLVSAAFKPIYLVGRYEIGAYPAFALLLGAGAQAAYARARSRKTVTIALIALGAVYVLLVGASMQSLYRARKPGRLEERAAVLVLKNQKPGDVIVTTGMTRATFEYYFRRAGGDPTTIESYPAEIASHLGWFDAPAMLRDRASLEPEAQRLVERLRQRGGAVHMVASSGGRDLDHITSMVEESLKREARTSTSLMSFKIPGFARPYYEVKSFDLSR